MSGFNEWLERKYPEYLWEEEDINPAGIPNNPTPNYDQFDPDDLKELLKRLEYAKRGNRIFWDNVGKLDKMSLYYYAKSKGIDLNPNDREKNPSKFDQALLNLYNVMVKNLKDGNMPRNTPRNMTRKLGARPPEVKADFNAAYFGYLSDLADSVDNDMPDDTPDGSLGNSDMLRNLAEYVKKVTNYIATEVANPKWDKKAYERTIFQNLFGGGRKHELVPRKEQLTNWYINFHPFGCPFVCDRLEILNKHGKNDPDSYRSTRVWSNAREDADHQQNIKQLEAIYTMIQTDVAKQQNLIKGFYGPDILREYKKIEDYKSSNYDIEDWVSQFSRKSNLPLKYPPELFRSQK
jgi:hypothetical protein